MVVWKERGRIRLEIALTGSSGACLQTNALYIGCNGAENGKSTCARLTQMSANFSGGFGGTWLCGTYSPGSTVVPALLVRGETGRPSPEAIIRAQWTRMGLTNTLAFGTNVSASELLTRAAKTVHTLTHCPLASRTSGDCGHALHNCWPLA